MRLVALVCGLPMTLYQAPVFAHNATSTVHPAGKPKNQVNSFFSSKFGPIMISAGPATQGGFGISISGNQGTPLSSLHSNLPTTQGKDAWYQSYLTSLNYKLNGLFTTRSSSPNNASVSLDPGIDLGLYYGHYAPPAIGCKPKKNKDGTYTFCEPTLPTAIAGFGVQGDLEYRYGSLKQNGHLSNANQALVGVSAYAVPSYFRAEPWIVVPPMLTFSYYKPVTTRTALITLPTNIKADYFQTEFHTEVGWDFFGMMSKVNDQYPILLDVKYDGSKPLGGMDQRWQSLWRIQLAFGITGSGIKPAITYQSGSQGGFKFDREVIVGVVAELFNPTK